MSHLTPPDPDLPFRRQQTEAYLNLFRISRVMLERSEALFAAAGLEDVTPAQASVLMLLFQDKRPLTAREIAASLEIAEVTVSRFVAALERSGWIERRPDRADARARLIRPTPRAYDALPRFIHVSNALLDASFAGFSRDEIEALTRAVEQVRANLSDQSPG